MKRNPHLATGYWPLLFLWILALGPWCFEMTTGAAEATGGETSLRGHVVCIAEQMNKSHGAELPSTHEHIYGFKSNDGKVYTLLRTKFSEAIFLDEKVRQRELLLKVRLFPESNAIEVTNIKSVKSGAVYDLFYYCDVCSIEMVAPLPCDCCRGPVVLTERPLKNAVKNAR